MSEIKQETKDLAARIKPEIKLNEKTGVGVISPELYEKLLPEGLTKKMAESFQAHNSSLIAATTYALGEIGVPAMKKNKDLDSVSVEMPTVGKDYIGVKINRSRTVPEGGRDGVSGTKTKYGTTSIEMNVYASKPRGELSKVKSWISEQADAAFGS